MTVISTQSLQQTYRSGVQAVAGIDLAIEQGEIYGFLGPNGAGKTTTVRMLVTLLQPTGGTAHVAGFDVARKPHEVRKRIGVALQEAALDPLMTGKELIELQATLHGINPRSVHQQGQELIERVGLEQAQDRRVGTYSGGMRRRLDLAMALIHSPEVLFLDEPTTGLDPASRMTLWKEVERLKNEGTTVFLTTQYLEEADQLADRIGIIAGGKLVAENTPAQLKAEIGDPHLKITLVEPSQRTLALGIIKQLGDLTPKENQPEAELLLNIAEGARAIAPVVRALDDAKIEVCALEVLEPTLDDVFLATTGHLLEGTQEQAKETSSR